MEPGRNRTINSSVKSFPPFWLDTVNECLWRGGGRQGGSYRLGKLRALWPRVDHEAKPSRQAN
jgi:hypothetical protein